MARAPKIEQVDADEQLMVRLAWACEIQGLTQAAAAEKFGVTRLKVNKALGEARARGIVRIAINSAFAPCAALEQHLCDRFGLETASVVPLAKTVQRADLHGVLGSALGQHLAKFLARPEIRVFGMSWGNTLNMATRYMQPIDRPDLEIVSVMGGLAKGSDINSYEITTRLGDLCNADYSYFTAPIYAGSSDSRDLLQAQGVFRKATQKICAADGLALAAGNMESSLLLKDGLPDDIDADELRQSGAVGDVIGYFLDADGQVLDHPINARVLGIGLDDLKNIPNVIMAAGGCDKLPILRAVLRRGFVNMLVTDEETAARLVADDA